MSEVPDFSLIALKERIALCEDFTPKERDFILTAINITTGGVLDDPEQAAVYDLGRFLGMFHGDAAFLKQLGASAAVLARAQEAVAALLAELRANADAQVDAMTAKIRNGICPDCGVQGLVHGPCGGSSLNVFCGKCGAGFNAHGAVQFGYKNLRFTFASDRLGDPYRDPRQPERECDHCGKRYRGPAVYCSLACAKADA